MRRPLSSSTVPPQLDCLWPFIPQWSNGCNSFTLSWRNSTPVFASNSEKQGAISHSSTSAVKNSYYNNQALDFIWKECWTIFSIETRNDVLIIWSRKKYLQIEAHTTWVWKQIDQTDQLEAPDPTFDKVTKSVEKRWEWHVTVLVFRYYLLFTRRKGNDINELKCTYAICISWWSNQKMLVCKLLNF